MTPYEAWNGVKPDLRTLRVFGSRVCVKQTGFRTAKLDHHHYDGIFIGYTATDQNIRYIDTTSGLVKTTHHAVFDEAWYSQKHRPPIAQLLYDLGFEQLPDETQTTLEPSTDETHSSDQADDKLQSTDHNNTPKYHTNNNPPVQVHATQTTDFTDKPSDMVTKYHITQDDLRVVYFSNTPFYTSFEEVIPYKYFRYRAPSTHPTMGLIFKQIDDRIYLVDIAHSTPCAQIPRWRTRLRNAWLVAVNGQQVTTPADVTAILDMIVTTNKDCSLLFAHPEIAQGLTNEGIPQVNVDQLNNRYHHTMATDHQKVQPSCNKLLRRNLLKQQDWNEWQQAEFTQLDQYDIQKMWGRPIKPTKAFAVFSLVWTYVIKDLDQCKKARMTCDGSSRGGVVQVFNHTYANSPDQVAQRLFWAVTTAENMVAYGSDVSNAFAEAPPPKQGFYIRPDQAFRDWWIAKGRDPIPEGWVIPVLSAMQGHPESPRLWERHIDGILRSISLTPTTHEPCLYSGNIEGQRILLLRQVDDFSTAGKSEQACSRVLDLIDQKLSIPMKRYGRITLFNGMDIEQTEFYTKISCTTYIEKICEKYLDTWMRGYHLPAINPTPLPTNKQFNAAFHSQKGDPTKLEELEKTMGFKYRNAIGELIYALVTCRPDIAYGVIKCAQFTTNPDEVHFNAIKHMLKYLYITRHNGIYFWRPTKNSTLPPGQLPTINSNAHDLLSDGRPKHTPTELHGYVDSDWATCPLTRRSIPGICIRLAGGTIAYKTKLQQTVALSSTEAEFMGAADFGRIILYIRSILWDIGVPQQAASILYEDNNACTSMAMAQKPTPRTRHMDIKYHVLCEWVEQDLIKLERIATKINMADHFTKNLSPILFRRHTDYIMGRVPPQYSPLHSLSPQSDKQLVTCSRIEIWTTICFPLQYGASKRGGVLGTSYVDYNAT